MMPFVSAGDLNVYYIEQGSGAPVVFVHGNWATSAWWEPVLARLPDGWRGIAYDLRGRGQTAGPDSDYSIPSLAADLRSFTEALGLDSMHLVGHSLGSTIAMQFALDHPARVRSLAVVAPAWVDGMPADAILEERQQALKANPALFGMALKAIAPSVPDDDYWKRLVAEGHTQRLTAALGAIGAMARWKPGGRLRSIPCPKLVIGGEQDILVTLPFVERAAQALGADHVILPGVGHSPNIEAPDALVNQIFINFKKT